MSAVMRIACVFTFMLGLGAGVSACNTVEGVGKDLTSAGRALNKAAGN